MFEVNNPHANVRIVKTSLKLPVLVNIIDKARKYADEGPGTKVGPQVYVYPAIRLDFFEDRALLARVSGTELWVESRDVEGITTYDGLKALGKSLPELLQQYLDGNNVYTFNVFEVGDEDPEWPDYSREARLR